MTKKLKNVFLNSLMKYQTNNPFRKNANDNSPLVLLLQVIKLLKDDPDENDAGVFRSELSLIICWPDRNAQALYEKIKELRRHYPLANIVPIDYDPGASEVNQLNRIKLMMSASFKNMDKEQNIDDIISPKENIDNNQLQGQFS